MGERITYEKEYWRGKKIAFLGDSITELNGFQAHLQKLLELDTIYSYGRCGTTISGHNASFTVRAKDMKKDADLIFIFGGTNDFHENAPLGAYKEAASEETFYGAMRLLCDILKEEYNNSSIVFITPLQRVLPPKEGTDIKNKFGLELTDYVEAIKKVCAEYEFSILDLYSTSDITVETAEKYLYDGIHPNAEGFDVLANEIAAYLCHDEDL